MINDLPSQSLWSLGGVGDAQFQVNAIALVCGGGVRVGLEDSIWHDQKRTKQTTNLELLQRIHNLSVVVDRPLMTSEVLRKRLNLENGYGQYGRVGRQLLKDQIDE